MTSRDIYDRRSTSTSRGKTIQRILDHQHAPHTIPGAQELLADAPEGSIAAAITAFHLEHVELGPVTSRRGYERSLALLVRDLDQDGPSLAGPLLALTRARLIAHLDWRCAQGLVDLGELQRCALHIARLAEWIAARSGDEVLVTRDEMRAEGALRIEQSPPAFHAATSSDELRDTSGDAAVLDEQQQ